MQATILLVADYAVVDSSGKLTIVGAFNRIFAKQLPVTHPMMYVVTRLTAELGEFDIDRTLQMILWDEDGNRTWETPKLPFKVIPPIAGKRSEHHAIIGLQAMKFTKAGAYEFKVYVDRDLVGSIPLDLVLMPSTDSKES